MIRSPRVVFDCNVYFQSLISASGPAGRLLALAAQRKIELFTSVYVLAELSELTADDRIRRKYRLSADLLQEYLVQVDSIATLVESVPSLFTFPRDPDDAHYVDLAVAANANRIVSRDKDLLSLTDGSTPESLAFQQRFPEILILTPSELLARLDDNG